MDCGRSSDGPKLTHEIEDWKARNEQKRRQNTTKG